MTFVPVCLQHGAIVMLYHPCADPAQVDKLRDIVTHCLRKHIITPYKQLPQQTPFALLSWGCKLMMSSVTTSVARNFIKVRLSYDCVQSLLCMYIFMVPCRALARKQ